ncbi:hypothetical protein PQB77_gp71 [Arthrobacter phage Correa]|uniref:Uncharacterized protein n=4 Tax=Mudcatvirus TaxID=1982088 RepID=A0A222ZK32_9CAUD|nr:hypothetical protein PQB75_gp076 [Arthrobacter phage Tribby]YP_010666260.1 hypothetical protein PQB76_gp073 [Arthrobacter phage Cheesy]YP_010666359.1 hypothetical protein PQB77_gp71 [Arthrobacter phage Correa]YP_010666453.1 hypothetical protein PQB78_gp69 [Arthrobacter phage Xenomorph]ASR80130.1 hypothetical protein SEA_CORREA_71 [Arthrobacter phage Correa]ASR80527.1 hypothetical protein SEA_TRIBBY_76 [Arthrobacter phage Tribby]ASR84652.1 hypothetical protein SEA_CHEESY_73 [Arthrobacter ph
METKSGETTEQVAKQYTYKPLPVTAIQLTEENLWLVAAWTNSRIVRLGTKQDPIDVYEGLDLKTAAGMKRVNFGDYIMYDTQQEKFYRISKEVFESTFDEVA